MRAGVSQPVHYAARTDDIQLRQEQGYDRAAFQHHRRMVEPVRGTDDRRPRAHHANEKHRRHRAGDIHLHRTFDGSACGARQFGQGFVFARPDLSVDPKQDISLHRRRTQKDADTIGHHGVGFVQHLMYSFS